MDIQVNMIIQYVSGMDTWLERVLCIDAEGKHVVVTEINANGRLHMTALPKIEEYDAIQEALKCSDAHVLRIDPTARRFPDESEINEKHRFRRDRAWSAIEALVARNDFAMYKPGQRGRLIREAASQHGISGKIVLRWLRQYWQRGQTKNALLPDYDRCGGRGKEKATVQKHGRPSRREKTTGAPQAIKVDERVKSIFRRVYEETYLTTKKPSLKKTYIEMLSKYFNAGFEIKDGAPIPILLPPSERPTLEQFRYWVEKFRTEDPSGASRKREGGRRYNLRHRGLYNASITAFGPGAEYQIDSTHADIYLVSSIRPERIIGRPTLYLVTDTFSRVCVGFAVTLEEPSWAGALLALENVLANKVEFCRQYKITITEEEWPGGGCLPARILADRGEFSGYNADVLVNDLGVQVTNTPTGRADLKGIIEREFRSLNDLVIKDLPGAVTKIERGDPDYRLKARLTLFQLRQILICCIVRNNCYHWLKTYPLQRDMIKDQVELYPADLWDWGICNRKSSLRAVSDPLATRLRLLPRAEASVTERGIRFRKALYECELAMKENWAFLARNKGRWRISIAYDPRLSDVIYYLPRDNQQLPVACELKDEKYRGLEWLEIYDLHEEQAERREIARSVEDDALAELGAHVKDIVNNSPKRSITGLSKTKQLQGIGSNKRDERDLERDEDAQRRNGTGDSSETLERSDNLEEESQNIVTGKYIPAPSYFDMFREQRDKKRNHE